MKMKHLILTAMAAILSMLMVSCEITEAFNEAPVIRSINLESSRAGNGLIYTNETVVLTVDAYDPEGDPLTYEWSISEGEGHLEGEGGVSVTWTAPQEAGVYVITCTVSDRDGATAAKQFDLHVIKHAFVTAIEVNGNNPVNPSSVISIEAKVSDEELAEDFQYTWELLDGETRTQIGIGRIIQWKTPAEEGEYKLLCTVVKHQGADPVVVEVTVSSNFNLFGTRIIVNHGMGHNIEPRTTIDLRCDIDAKSDHYDFTWNLVQGEVVTQIGMGNPITWRTPGEEGNYIVSVTASRTSDGQESTAHASIFSYYPLENTTKMYGIIRDVHSNDLLSGVTLFWYRDGVENSVTTNENGYYYIPEMVSGKPHEIIFSREGYARATFNLSGNDTDGVERIEKNFNMYEMNAAFGGRIYLQQDDETIHAGSGITVEVTVPFTKDNLTNLTPGRWTTQTDADGFYHFDALPVVFGMASRTLPHYEHGFVYNSEDFTLNLIPNGSFTHDYKLIQSTSEVPFIVSNNMVYHGADEIFPVDGSFLVTFSKPMIPSSVKYTFSGEVTSIDKTWSNENMTLRLTPVEVLKEETNYTLTFTDGRSTDNVRINVGHPSNEFNFSTPNRIVLLETNLKKVEGEPYDRYDSNEPIMLRFDREIDEERTREEHAKGTFKLTRGTETVQTTLTFNGDVLYITPENILDDEMVLYNLEFKVFSISPAQNANCWYGTHANADKAPLEFTTATTDILPERVTGFDFDDELTFEQNTVWVRWNEVQGARFYRVYARLTPAAGASDFILVEDEIKIDEEEEFRALIDFDNLGEKDEFFLRGRNVEFNIVAVNNKGESPASEYRSLSFQNPSKIEGFQKDQLINWYTEFNLDESDEDYEALTIYWSTDDHADYYELEAWYDNGGAVVNRKYYFLSSDEDFDPSLGVVIDISPLVGAGPFMFEEDRSDSLTFRVRAMNKRQWDNDTNWEDDDERWSNLLVFKNETPSVVEFDPDNDTHEDHKEFNIEQLAAVDFNTHEIDFRWPAAESNSDYGDVGDLRYVVVATWYNKDGNEMIPLLNDDNDDDGIRRLPSLDQTANDTYTVNFSSLMNEIVDTDDRPAGLFSNGAYVEFTVIAVNDAGESSESVIIAKIQDVVGPTVTSINIGQTLDNSAGTDPLVVECTIRFSERLNLAGGAPGSIVIDNALCTISPLTWNPDIPRQASFTITVPAGEDASGSNLTVDEYEDTSGNAMEEHVFEDLP